MVQFTKKAIEQAFMELISERPLDKITVKDIVSRCGVNRNTFYYYYQDVYALIDDLFEAETQRIIGQDTNFESWQEGFLKATNFAYNNKQAIFHIYKSVSREQLESYLNRVAMNNMLKFVKRQAKGLKVSDKNIRMISLFYTHALVGITLEWINDGMKEDPTEYINTLGNLLEGNIRYTLTKNESNI